jgi:hypothetical protein
MYGTEGAVLSSGFFMKENSNSIEPNKTETTITEEIDYPLGWWIGSFWILAVGLGFFHTWADRHYLVNADAMSYLDIADAYLRGDWHAAVNSYWSPLYSWLIALALLIAKPSPYWKFSVLHLMNFAIYLLALAFFGFLLNELIQFNRERRSELLGETLVSLPDWAWLALGYPLFIWSSLYLIGISQESPDLLVTALVYLACGILLRIRRQRESWVHFISLGLTLGFGYLAKTVMFPLSFIFLAVALFSVGNLRRALPRTVVALIAFFLIAGPFIIAISRAKGRFTFGDSGRLNYSWSINRIPHYWQGDRSGNGAPRHPPRKISDEPAVYEFGDPVAGTYPIHYDPSYWYEGVASHFDLWGQLRSLGTGIRAFYELFFSNVQYGLFVGFLSLYLISRRRWLLMYDLIPYWCLIIPAMAGLGIYSLINVQGRYIAAFMVLLWLGLFSSLRLSNSQESKTSIACVTLVLLVMMVLTVTASSAREAFATTHSMIAGEDVSAHEQWQVAEGLRQMGVQPGDKVAVIGNSFRAFWAHLAALHIVAEISGGDAITFWAADAPVKKVAIDTLARTGARAIVAENPPLRVEPTWQKIRNTDYYAYLLSR